VCCYPTEPGLVQAIAQLIRPAWHKAAVHGQPRVLFSAHGLPKKVIAGGDPYQHHVEQTSAAVASALRDLAELDWRISYQSRVGPMEWIGPSTDDEIRRAGAEHRPLVVVPVAFVSEHSETLVELDIEYRHLATEAGVPAYERVAAVGTHPEFIASLARLVRLAAAGERAICAGAGQRQCPTDCSRCPQGNRS
jgi:ferrochelatase